MSGSRAFSRDGRSCHRLAGQARARWVCPSARCPCSGLSRSRKRYCRRRSAWRRRKNHDAANQWRLATPRLRLHQRRRRSPDPHRTACAPPAVHAALCLAVPECCCRRSGTRCPPARHAAPRTWPPAPHYLRRRCRRRRRKGWRAWTCSCLPRCRSPCRK